jgi:Na+-transporting methylmalonyl-CoA/oxaloacetate decarboxylase gamma subunit
MRGVAFELAKALEQDVEIKSRSVCLVILAEALSGLAAATRSFADAAASVDATAEHRLGKAADHLSRAKDAIAAGTVYLRPHVRR